MPNIDDRIEIAAPRARVLEALTTERGNQGWWTKRAKVGVGVGAPAEFRFDGGATAFKFRIDAIDENAVRMTCIGHENSPDWEGTTLKWELKDAGKGTVVELHHDGWRTKSDTYERCIPGWRHFMGSLKSYVETGKGTPFDG
jgi:uncharacterized protein YndB with AHSA1/START domain